MPEATEVNVEGCISIDGVDYVIKRTVTRPSLAKRTDKSKVSHKKSNAMKVRIYWDMCPYCEEEVEFYDLRDQQCPYCGLHFTPAQDSYYEDVEED